MKSILGAGNALTDLVFTLPDKSLLEGLGLRAGSMTHVGRQEQERLLGLLEGCGRAVIPGGSAANTVAATARLGLSSGFIGMVGDDAIGRIYAEEMQGSGVEAHLLKGRNPSGTAIAIITPSDGERTFATYLGAALELSPEHIDCNLFLGYDIFHLEGYLIQCPQVVEQMLRCAKLRGMTISFDLGSFNIVERNRSLLQSLVGEYVDIVFANGEEAEAFTGEGPEGAAQAISSMGKGKIAVVKLGADGSIVRRGSQVCRVEAKRVKAIDTTGAGDAYAAGFLYAFAHGAELNDCGVCGTVLASEAVVELGPKIGKNGWEVVKKGVGEILKAKD